MNNLEDKKYIKPLRVLNLHICLQVFHIQLLILYIKIQILNYQHHFQHVTVVTLFVLQPHKAMSLINWHHQSNRKQTTIPMVNLW
jgi:hypothetical protein